MAVASAPAPRMTFVARFHARVDSSPGEPGLACQRATVADQLPDHELGVAHPDPVVRPYGRRLVNPSAVDERPVCRPRVHDQPGETLADEIGVIPRRALVVDEDAGGRVAANPHPVPVKRPPGRSGLRAGLLQKQPALTL